MLDPGRPCPLGVVAVGFAHVGHAFCSLPHFCARLTGRGEGLLARRLDPLARLAAGDVAEGVLEALGAAGGRGPPPGAVLLPRPPLTVAAAGPGGVRLAEAAGPV